MQQLNPQTQGNVQSQQYAQQQQQYIPSTQAQQQEQQEYQQQWQLQQQQTSQEVEALQNTWSQSEIKAALRDQLTKIFDKEKLYQYDEIISRMSTGFSIHISYLFYSAIIQSLVQNNYPLFLSVVNELSSEKLLEYDKDFLKPCNTTQNRKVGIGLKSFKGNDKFELTQYLKECDIFNYNKIRIEKVKQAYNLYFQEEKVLQRYETWLKKNGHHLKIHFESATKEFYKLQQKSKRFKTQNPMYMYDQSQYYSSKTTKSASTRGGNKQQFYQKGSGGRYNNYQNRGGGGGGIYHRGGRGGNKFYNNRGRGGGGQQYHRPRLDSNNFPDLSQSLEKGGGEAAAAAEGVVIKEQQKQEEQVSKKYSLQDFFKYFNSHKFQKASSSLVQGLQKLPQINGTKLYVDQPHLNLALLQACANQMVNKQSHRKQSMTQDEDSKANNNPESFNFLKKATVLTGNHYKLRNRAMSQNTVEQHQKLPDSIQKIIQEQIADENQQKNTTTAQSSSDEKGSGESSKAAQRQRLLTMD